MGEFESSLALLKQIQRRTAWNVFLREYAGWLAKILLGLLLAVALSPSLYWAVLAAAALGVAGLVVAAAAARKNLPSAYQAAQMADRAAGLKDRLSTAVYFTDAGETNPMILRQRADAAEHASRLNPGTLFPVRTPPAARYALVFLLAVAALFAYRLHSSGPPLLALLKRASDTRLVRAIVTPIVHAMNREDPQRNEATRIAGTRASDEQKARDSQSRGAESQEGKAGERGANQGARSEAEARRRKQEDQPQQQAEQQQGASGQGEQQEAQDGRGQQGSDGEQSQQGNGKQQQANNSGQSGQQAARQQNRGGSEGAAGRGQSLAQSIVQAIKNLFSRPSNGQSAPAQGQTAQNAGQQGPSQSQPQSGAPGQQSPGNQGQGQQQQSQNQQQAGQNQQNGLRAGTTAGSQEPGAANDFLGSHPKPETVDTPVQQFTGQAQVRARAGDGVVSTPARNAATPSISAPLGAEQENIPLRYRAYLQRYFDRAKSGRK